MPGLIDYNFLKLREAIGKVFAVRNRIMQQEAGAPWIFLLPRCFTRLLPDLTGLRR